MLSPIWLIWMIFLFMFLVAPVGYGWGYRGWGAPYPRYIQHRRAREAGAIGSAPHNHHAWGRGGDLVWLGVFIAVVWACLAFLAMR